jgi:hypothetical protein
VTFEDLSETQRELLADAYREQRVQRARAWIGIPLCVAGSAAAAWFFIVGDESGYGGYLGWPMAVALGAVALWMLVETILERGVERVIRTFGLELGAERTLRASLRVAPSLAEERRRARMEIEDELFEGGRRALKKDWWGTLWK